MDINRILKRMMHKTAIAKSTGELLIVDQPLALDIWRYAPPAAESATIIEKRGLKVYAQERELKRGDKIAVAEYANLWITGGLTIKSDSVSREVSDKWFTIAYKVKTQLFIEKFYFTAYRFYIEADYKHNRKISDAGSNPDWLGEKNGQGPILMVKNTQAEKKEYRAYFNIVKEGPPKLPGKYAIIMKTNAADAKRVAIYRLSGEKLIGDGKNWVTLDFSSGSRRRFYAYALEYPGKFFDGFIEILVNAVVSAGRTAGNAGYTGRQTFWLKSRDVTSMTFRVAPWLMSSNTEPVKQIYVQEKPYAFFDEKGYHSNEEFIEELKKIAEPGSIHIISKDYMQGLYGLPSLVQAGYSQLPSMLRRPENIPVFLNFTGDVTGATPGWAERRTLVQAGYQTIDKIRMGKFHKNAHINELGMTNNYQLTPPIKNFPLGRIVYGTSRKKVNCGGRMQAFTDFIQAQKIQKPIAVGTDWLVGGNIATILGFVPCLGGESDFKLLVASPLKFYTLLEALVQLQSSNQQTLLLKPPDQLTIGGILSDTTIRNANMKFQGYIDEICEMLIKELEITEDDIIPMPMYFRLQECDPEEAQALGGMPSLTDMLVLNCQLFLPKPFGPVMQGDCQIEKYVKEALAPFGLRCFFTDKWQFGNSVNDSHNCVTIVRAGLTYPWWKVTC